jgi:hypothetical protein
VESGEEGGGAEGGGGSGSGQHGVVHTRLHVATVNHKS